MCSFRRVTWNAIEQHDGGLAAIPSASHILKWGRCCYTQVPARRAFTDRRGGAERYQEYLIVVGGQSNGRCYSRGLWHLLRRNAIGQDTGNQFRIAILFVADDLAILEMNHEDVVVVIALT